MTRVKICGNTNLHDAKAALSLGADALGFIVGLAPGSKKRSISAQDAAHIISLLPEETATVLVTTTSDPKELIALASESHVTTLQLHGDTPPEGIWEIKKALPAITVWKVVSVNGADALTEAKRYEKYADGILLDSGGGEGGEGGTGKTHDWSISRAIVKSLKIRVLLAGGLNPENVAEAVAAVHPYGVDANSGVSNPDGTKDLEKVKAFIERAKDA